MDKNLGTVELDGKELESIASRSHTASVTANALATRERIRHFSDISRTRSQLIRQGEKIVDSDYMQFWTDLQNAGVGSIIYGRKNKPDRFAWHYSLKSVSKAMLEGTNEKVGRASHRLVDTQPKKEVSRTSGFAHSPDSQTVKIVLANNRIVEFRTPKNLTKREVETVMKALNSVSI